LRKPDKRIKNRHTGISEEVSTYKGTSGLVIIQKLGEIKAENNSEKLKK